MMHLSHWDTSTASPDAGDSDTAHQPCRPGRGEPRGVIERACGKGEFVQAGLQNAAQRYRESGADVADVHQDEFPSRAGRRPQSRTRCRPRRRIRRCSAHRYKGDQGTTLTLAVDTVMGAGRRIIDGEDPPLPNPPSAIIQTCVMPDRSADQCARADGGQVGHLRFGAGSRNAETSTIRVADATHTWWHAEVTFRVDRAIG
jgi:hypothetical protein